MPLPFKGTLEQWLGRAAYNGYDFYVVEQIKKKRAKDAEPPAW